MRNQVPGLEDPKLHLVSLAPRGVVGKTKSRGGPPTHQGKRNDKGDAEDPPVEAPWSRESPTSQRLQHWSSTSGDAGRRRLDGP